MENTSPQLDDTADYDKPVAYDVQGRPLYLHPPTNADEPTPVVKTKKTVKKTEKPAGEPQVVYMSRAVDPKAPVISPEVRQKHDESVKRYPYLNLSDGEYVISAIKRHPIGLVSIWAVVIAAVLVVLIIFPTIFVTQAQSMFRLSDGLLINGAIIILLLAVLAVMAGAMATTIYNANRFYLTNECVTQHIQTGLFSRKDQTISLMNIEDASFRQNGLLQTIMNYGSIRLSTQGEETTYRFNFVADPKRQVDLLNDAVEAFKNYRPVDTLEHAME